MIIMMAMIVEVGVVLRVIVMEMVMTMYDHWSCAELMMK